jgi:organic radical activating enzyme
MKICNIRLGMATNSSSTHSIILNPSVKRFSENTLEFGWQNFLLKSEEAKENYLAVTLYENIEKTLSEDYAKLIVNKLFEREIVKNGEYSYVDHQSLIALPVSYKNRKQIDLNFFADFRNYIADKNIGIAGGNDNNERMDYGGEEKLKFLPKEYGTENFVCRKDKDYWILFNTSNGTKIRFSFVTDEPYTKATRPELVDYKITNFCPYGCEFCYMKSTIEGKAATNFSHVIQVLSELETFECSIAGGEPTLYPYFAKFLKEAREEGIVPTFTTFNMNWKKNKEIEEAVLKYAGGFAVSINEYQYDKIKEIRNWIDETNYKGYVSIQSILGICDTYAVEKLIELAKKERIINLTLLGYKSFGRGEGIIPKKVDIKRIFDKAKKNYINIGVDTLALKDYAKEIQEYEIPEILMTKQEGKFSMYIDGIENKIARDSYTNEMIDYEPNYNDLKEKILTNFPFE